MGDPIRLNEAALVTAERPPLSEPLARPQPATQIQAWLQTDNAVLAAMLGAIALYYFSTGLPLAILGGGLFFLLAVWRPRLTIACITLAIPLFYRPREIDLGSRALYFPLAETLIFEAVAAWIVYDFRLLILDFGLRKPSVAAIQNPKSKIQNAVWAGLSWPFVWCAVAFLIVGAASLVLPPLVNRGAALIEFRRSVLEPLLFFALIARFVRSEDDILRALNAFLITSAIGGSIGAQQFLYGETWSMEGVGRATGVWPGATAFGIFMGRALPIALVLAMFLPGTTAVLRRWRWAYALLAVPIAAGVITSFARGAWIGVAAALVVVIVITRNRWLLLALGAGAVALVPIFFLFLRNIPRITSLFDAENGTGTSRIIIWQSALRVIRDHRLTGIGLDQFLYQDARYGIPNIRFLTVSHPHNFILDFWLRLGVWGLAAMIATLVSFFVSGLRAYRRFAGTVLGAIALALIASMTDFVVHGLLDMAYFYQDLALTFWFTVGLMAVVWWHTQRRMGEEEAEASRPLAAGSNQ